MNLPRVFWFTGLSGAGKTTLANSLQAILQNHKILSCILDGDEMRKGLCSDLGFTLKDRSENIRRIAECAKIVTEAGFACSVACITPLHSQRMLAKQILSDRYVEIFVSCSLEQCQKRDVKGLYGRFGAGMLEDFTGLSSPYEEPVTPDLVLKTETNSLQSCLDDMHAFIKKRFL